MIFTFLNGLLFLFAGLLFLISSIVMIYHLCTFKRGQHERDQKEVK